MLSVKRASSVGVMNGSFAYIGAEDGNTSKDAP